MVKCNNLYDNKNIDVIASKGGVKVLEYKKDLSVNTGNAMAAGLGLVALAGALFVGSKKVFA